MPSYCFGYVEPWMDDGDTDSAISRFGVGISLPSRGHLKEEIIAKLLFLSPPSNEIHHKGSA